MAYFRDVAILGVSRRGVDAKTQIEKNTPSKHKSFSYENGISVSGEDMESAGEKDEAESIRRKVEEFVKSPEVQEVTKKNAD